MERQLPDETVELLMIKAMLVDSHYTAMIAHSFERVFFDNESVGDIFTYVSDYFKQYKKIPPQQLIRSSLNDDEVSNTLKAVNEFDYDISKHIEHITSESNLYLKEKAFKDALMKGVELIENGESPLAYKEIMESALSKDLSCDLGVNYWDTLVQRTLNIIKNTDVRTKTGFASLDEFTGGGFPPYTLSVFLSRIHGFKSNFLVNMVSRQSLLGYSPLIISLEMSEAAICQRFDSIFSNMNINRMYITETNAKTMLKEIKKVQKSVKKPGTIIIKELPTGSTVQDIETLIRELHYRGIKPNPIVVDYLQLLRGTGKEQRYEELQRIAEDLRAMSLKFDVPVVSVCQINRESMAKEINEIQLDAIAGSIGVSATADAVFVFGKDSDDLTYESELHYRTLKNRLGGRVNEVDKLYIDKASLRMYDSSELDLWISNSKKSGGDCSKAQ